MRSLHSAGDRAAALTVLVIVAAIAFAFAGCAPCSASRSSVSVVTADYFRVVDLTTCRHMAVWMVRPAFRFHGVDHPADSTLARDSVVDPFTCATRPAR